MEEGLIWQELGTHDTDDQTTTFDEVIDGRTYFFIEQDIHDKFSRSIWFICRWEATSAKLEDIRFFNVV